MKTHKDQIIAIALKVINVKVRIRIRRRIAHTFSQLVDMINLF